MAANARNELTYWLKQIADSLEGLQYGHVQITVHDGKIVQIDRLERKRFELTGHLAPGPGKDGRSGKG